MNLVSLTGTLIPIVFRFTPLAQNNGTAPSTHLLPLPSARDVRAPSALSSSRASEVAPRWAHARVWAVAKRPRRPELGMLGDVR